MQFRWPLQGHSLFLYVYGSFKLMSRVTMSIDAILGRVLCTLTQTAMALLPIVRLFSHARLEAVWRVWTHHK